MGRNNGVNIVEAWRDPELFGSQYQDFDSWTNWQTLVKSVVWVTVDRRRIVVLQGSERAGHSPSATSIGSVAAHRQAKR